MNASFKSRARQWLAGTPQGLAVQAGLSLTLLVFAVYDFMWADWTAGLLSSILAIANAVLTWRMNQKIVKESRIASDAENA